MTNGVELVKELLRQFGVAPDGAAAADFVELVRHIAEYRWQNPSAEYGAGEVLRAFAAEKHTYYLALDQRMKAAVRPLLDASDAQLDAYALRLSKRTVCALAWACSEYILL